LFCEQNEIILCWANNHIKELVTEQQFDLIFIDYETPSINPLYIIMLFRSHRNTRDASICILDTKGDPLNRVFCTQILEVDEYITGSILKMPDILRHIHSNNPSSDEK
jgi:response regulator RpfG family c-di-GMP phosphodiesterase